MVNNRFPMYSSTEEFALEKDFQKDHVIYLSWEYIYRSLSSLYRSIHFNSFSL